MLPSLLLACAGPSPEDGPPTAVDLAPLELWWTPTDGGLDAAQLRAGIDWNLSLLGALPPADGGHLELTPADDGWSVWLDPAAAGFPEAAHAALTDALAEVRAAPAPTDVGRLFMLTLHEPWRYYAITGACGSLGAWRAARQVPEGDRYDVVFSLLSAGDRVVLLPPAGTAVQEVAFLVATGTGPLQEGWVPAELEVLDLMGNGQQRFAAFGLDGALEPYADPAVVPAGQPGKCQWCHEDHLMTGTPDNPSTEAGIGTEAWLERVEGWQAALEAWRATMGTAVAWEEPQAHTWGELVVREFLLPTVDRAAAEWGIDAEEAWALVEAEGLWAEVDEEYPERGTVLRRSEVDAGLAARGVAVPAVLDDAREPLPDAPLRGAAWAAWMPCTP